MIARSTGPGYAAGERAASTIGGLPDQTVSVVLTTCNRRDRLGEVLAPLLADEAVLEIVVVIDACDDGSFELLKGMAASTPKLRPLLLRHNVGQGCARMAGVHEARGTVILSLDDDVVAAPGLVSGHRRRHDERAARVVLGYMPLALPTRRRPGQLGTFEYGLSYEEHCREYERNPRAILTNFWGGNFSVARSALLAAERNVRVLPPLYHEDRILGLSFLRAGLEPVFDRSLRAEHRYERPFGAYLRDSRRMGASHPVLHAAFGDLIGPYRFDAELVAAPRRARPLVRLADRPRARPLVLAGIRGLVFVAGRLHAFGLETRLGRIAIRIEDRRGAREGAAGRFPTADRRP
jgi:glycosyltransferase involved in cell wall biosynthesis